MALTGTGTIDFKDLLTWSSVVPRAILTGIKGLACLFLAVNERIASASRL